MPRELTLESRVYAPGLLARRVTTSFEALAGYRLSFSREQWPEGLCAVVTLALTLPNGTTAIRRGELVGGPTIGRDGHPSTDSWMQATWPGRGVKDEAGKPVMERNGTFARHVLAPTRCDVTVDVKQAFRTAITLDTF